MSRTMRVSIAAALAGLLALTALGPAQARHYHHHRHYYGHHGNRAALRAFGLIAGTIASIAAAEQARRDCRRYGYCYGDGYGYGPPPYSVCYGYCVEFLGWPPPSAAKLENGPVNER